jgi:peroxiredoxin
MRVGIVSGSVVLACVLANGLVRAESAREGAKEAATRNVGKKIGNLSFKDAAGQAVSLYDFKDKKAIVVVFLSFECPVSNSYSQPLADMAQEYAKHGIAFLGLTTNLDETPEQVAKQARDFRVPFPVLRDDKLVAARTLQADTTPEVFVLDGSYYLRYRGRIDNAYSERLKKHPQVTQHNLRQVIGEMLSGRPISEPVTVAIGCPVPREEKTVAKTGEITFYRDVLPILQNQCQSCHRPGEVGPFSLMTYRQAANWADDIKTYTQRRLMPPWKPTEGQPFHNERRLSEKEIATLAAWADAYTPEGDPKDAPSPRTFPAGWQLGTPDLVLNVPEEFQLGATGRDLFRCFVMPTGLAEDTYVAAVEVRPSNPRIVHHTLLFVDAKGQGRKLEQKQQEKKAGEDAHPSETPQDRGPGYTVAMGVGFVPQGGLSGWAPGNLPRYLPEGSGYFLPKNSDVVMQIHFHRNGRVEKDRTQVGLYFAKKKVERVYQGGVLAGGSGGILGRYFTIPAGAERYNLKGDTWATQDFNLYSVMPHMHMVGKEIKVTLTPPEGAEQTLVFIKEWDYNWQETYFLKEPIKIKAGTRFHVEAFYDNSSKNPNNPFSPPRRVTFGEQTFNEMCFVFLGGTSDRLGRGLPLSGSAPKKDKSAAD